MGTPEWSITIRIERLYILSKWRISFKVIIYKPYYIYSLFKYYNCYYWYCSTTNLLLLLLLLIPLSVLLLLCLIEQSECSSRTMLVCKWEPPYLSMSRGSWPPIQRQTRWPLRMYWRLHSAFLIILMVSSYKTHYQYEDNVIFPIFLVLLSSGIGYY